MSVNETDVNMEDVYVNEDITNATNDKVEDDNIDDNVYVNPQYDDEEEDVGDEKPSEEKVEEEEEEEHKPWKSKNKGDVPVGVQKRFRELTTKVRDMEELLRRQEEQLKSTMPKEREFTRADFPDDESYLDYKVEQQLAEKLNKYQEAQKSDYAKALETETVVTRIKENEVKALTDIPDYYDIIQNADPDIRIPTKTIEELNKSPMAPYVKYRIASDPELTEQLKHATPDQKHLIIAEIHDGILEYKIKQESLKNAPVSEKPITNVNTNTNINSNKHQQSIRNVPKAPPKVKTGTTSNWSNMSGDDFAKQYIEKHGLR